MSVFRNTNHSRNNRSNINTNLYSTCSNNTCNKHHHNGSSYNIDYLNYNTNYILPNNDKKFSFSNKKPNTSKDISNIEENHRAKISLLDFNHNLNLLQHKIDKLNNILKFENSKESIGSYSNRPKKTIYAYSPKRSNISHFERNSPLKEKRNSEFVVYSSRKSPKRPQITLMSNLGHYNNTSSSHVNQLFNENFTITPKSTKYKETIIKNNKSYSDSENLSEIADQILDYNESYYQDVPDFNNNSKQINDSELHSSLMKELKSDIFTTLFARDKVNKENSLLNDQKGQTFENKQTNTASTKATFRENITNHEPIQENKIIHKQNNQEIKLKEQLIQKEIENTNIIILNPSNQNKDDSDVVSEPQKEESDNGLDELENFLHQNKIWTETKETDKNINVQENNENVNQINISNEKDANSDKKEEDKIISDKDNAEDIIKQDEHVLEDELINEEEHKEEEDSDEHHDEVHNNFDNNEFAKAISSSNLNESKISDTKTSLSKKRVTFSEKKEVLNFFEKSNVKCFEDDNGNILNLNKNKDFNIYELKRKKKLKPIIKITSVSVNSVNFSQDSFENRNSSLTDIHLSEKKKETEKKFSKIILKKMKKQKI